MTRRHPSERTGGPVALDAPAGDLPSSRAADAPAHSVETVFIANRGEIAVRIARTLQRLGIRSVLGCAAVDRDSPAAKAVDEVVPLEGTDPIATYLDIDAIVDAARRSGADALHPGYGFLAENADFAERVEAAGIRLIGPDPSVMRLMGDKIDSRNFVREHGFRVAPSAIEDDSHESYLRRAKEIGFPLLIKPSAGGGGKGMYVVRNERELEAKTEVARAEAARYFGDGRLYVERYVERPRHIEVQILADHRGNCVHIFERECSIQRRFQKLVEESPAPSLPEDLRARICEEAVGIARAAGYRNAGTIEFVVGADGEFHFLEMNTRLQVEHPVTEMVTGIDLVEQQVRIAAGEELPFTQEDIRRSGWAVECRVCAEDPERDFMPSVGDLLLVRPFTGPGIRFDGGIGAGQKVTAAFDPMLGKLIAHGPTREEAISRARRALEETVILGVTTNASFLRRVLAHPAFVGGATHTGFLGEHADDLRDPPLEDGERITLLTAAALASRDFRERVAAVPEPYASMGAWRN